MEATCPVWVVVAGRLISEIYLHCFSPHRHSLHLYCHSLHRHSLHRHFLSAPRELQFLHPLWVQRAVGRADSERWFGRSANLYISYSPRHLNSDGFGILANAIVQGKSASRVKKKKLWVINCNKCVNNHVSASLKLFVCAIDPIIPHVQWHVNFRCHEVSLKSSRVRRSTTILF